MVQVILNDEQARAVTSAPGAVELRDAQGNLVGYVAPRPSKAVIADAQRRAQSDGPWYTTTEVLDHLNGLEP